MCCALSGPFATAGIPSYNYTHSVLIVIVGPYTFESRIHKVAELPNNIEGLVGVQFCTLFLLQICLTDGSVNTTSASGIVPTVRWYYNEIHFSICILNTYNYRASVLPLAQEIGLV